VPQQAPQEEGGGLLPVEVAPPVELHPCHHCNRTFAKGRLEIHERVCQRIFGEKRHTYDALNKRTHDTPFRPTQAHKCNQCGRAFAHQEEMLVHERACGGNRSASRSRNKGRPMSSGGRGGNNELDNGWGPHTSVSSSNGSAIKSARRNRGSRTPSFGNQLRDGGSSIMLDTLDENELAQPMVGMRFAEEETEEEEGDISLAGPPSVVRVEGSGSLNSLNMKTPSGRSARIPRSANRSGNRSVTRVSFFDGVAYLAMFSKLILFTLDYLSNFFFSNRDRLHGRRINPMLVQVAPFANMKFTAVIYLHICYGAVVNKPVETMSGAMQKGGKKNKKET
jgi:hypothetical protein